MKAVSTVKVNFEQILKRIAIIDRDISELNRLKSKLPKDRHYFPGLQLTFDKQIQTLNLEKNSLYALNIKNPPQWLSNFYTNGKALTNGFHEDEEELVNFSPIVPVEGGEIISFLKAIPKTEVHLHLEACINKEALKNLLQRNNMEVSDEVFDEKFHFKDLNGFIQLFFFIQSAIHSADDFGLLIDSLANYMRNDNIIYAEVFLAPTRFLQNGLEFTEIMDVIVDRIREIKKEDGTEIRILVDVSRTFGVDNAMANLQKVLSLRYEEVIGIGLGGAELMGPARDYEPVFKLAREAGLHCVVHAGEDDGPWSIWDSLKYLKAERIGHGISAIQDPELMRYIKENKIPIEICLTSNMFTGKYVRKEENHPVRQYYDTGIITCINTDDPEIFGVSLTDEYYKLHKHLGFSIDEMIDLVKKGVFSSFHPKKDKLWKKMEAEIQRLKTKHAV
ncbi:MAG: adenosine deaminase [Leptospiraceae bacterium]|nr:adenosine deaminase [Leptospiraceae bacterium]